MSIQGLACLLTHPAREHFFKQEYQSIACYLTKFISRIISKIPLYCKCCLDTLCILNNVYILLMGFRIANKKEPWHVVKKIILRYT